MGGSRRNNRKSTKQTNAVSKIVNVAEERKYGEMTLNEFNKLRKLSTEKGKAKKEVPKSSSAKMHRKVLDDDGSRSGSNNRAEVGSNPGSERDRGFDESDSARKKSSKSKKRDAPVFNPNPDRHALVSISI